MIVGLPQPEMTNRKSASRMRSDLSSSLRACHSDCLLRLPLFLLTALTVSACCIQMPAPRPARLLDEDGGMLGPPLWPDGALVFGTTDNNGELFEAIGPKLDLYSGPQGGHHAYAKYQVRGQVAPSAVFENRVRRARDGLLVSGGSRTLDVKATAADGGVWASEGTIVMFMCPTAAGVSIVQEPLVFEVTAKSATGQLLSRVTVTSTLTCIGNTCEADCGG